MKITAIKQQVKRPDRYSIYVDGLYVFSLSESQLVAMGLHSGMELDAVQVDEYKQSSAEEKLFDRALNLFSYRRRSEWEVREYLRRKQAEQSQLESIVARLKSLGYIDDEVFARSWVESRRLGKPISSRKLRSELNAKRIDRAIVDHVLKEDNDTTDEREVLHRLIAKKRKQYPDNTKLMQYLARQGFSYDDIKYVLNSPPGEG